MDRGSATQSLERNLTIGGARNASANAFARIDFQNYDNNNSSVDYVGAYILSENDDEGDSGNLEFGTTSTTSGQTTRLEIFPDGEVRICNGTCSGVSITDGAGDLFVEDELEVQGNFRADAGSVIVNLTGSSTNGVCSDFAGTGVRTLYDCSGTPSDIAEWYPATGGATSTDIVVATDTLFEYEEELYSPHTGRQTGATNTYEVAVLEKSSEPYSERIIGIVSTSPWRVFGAQIKAAADEPIPVGLTGRVPTRVTDENGAIAAGDPITTSSTAGAGMKATKPGMIVGYALESWSDTGEGVINVLVQPQWHSGASIKTDGTLALFADDFTYDAKGTATASVTSYNSYAQNFRGSAWDSASSTAVTRDISIANNVTDKDTYELIFGNDDQETVAKLGNSGDLYISGKLFPSDRGTLQEDKYIFYDGAAGPGGDMMRTNASGWSTGSYDFAEMFPAEEGLEAGDIVIADPLTNEGIIASADPYQNTILGIISTKPGFLAGENKEGDLPVALIGRVPTKVNLENGVINIGDPITSSSVRGEGMKATEAGRVVGIALEKYDGSGEDNLIVVYVNPAWYNGPSNMSGDMSGETLSIEANSILNFQNSVIENVNAILSGNGSWSITSDGYLAAKHGEFDTVKAKAFVAVATDDLATTGEGMIRDGYTATVVQNPAMRANSRVFVTFLGDPGSAYWINARGDGDFTVNLSKPALGDLKFEYWILDIDDRRSGEGAPETEPEEISEEPTESASGTPETGEESLPEPEEDPPPDPEPTESASSTEETAS